MGRGDGNAASGEQSTSRGQCRLSSVGAGLELGREFFRQLMRHGGTQLRRLAADLGAWVGRPVTRLRHAREQARATTGDSPSRDLAAPRAWCARASVNSSMSHYHYDNHIFSR